MLLTAADSAAQDTAVRRLVSSDIVCIIGTDSGTRDVIAQVLADDAHNTRVTFVSASQIRRQWLPVTNGVHFVRLPDAALRTFLADCGRYWIVSRLQRTGNVVQVRLEQKCGCTSRDYTASLKGNVWWVNPNGIGCGCAGPQPECPCFGR